MALYLSYRALDESTGVSEDKLMLWKFAASEASKISGRAKAKGAAAESELASELTSTRAVDRPPTDTDIVGILQSKIDFKDVASEELNVGDFVKVSSDDYRHGCIPVATMNSRHQGELTAYLGEGVATRPKQSWWRRFLSMIGFGGQETKSVRLQVFGSADNYARWNPDKRSDLVGREGWFPSSPEGMGVILGAEADVPEGEIEAEINLNNRDHESPSFLCDGFDNVADGIFHNSHRQSGEPRKLSRGAQVDPRVTIWGSVYGVKAGEQNLNSAVMSRTVLVRPILIQGRNKARQ